MAATIVVACPNCKKQLKGPADIQGKKIRCKACGHTFSVQGPVAATKTAPSKAQGSAPTKPSAGGKPTSQSKSDPSSKTPKPPPAANKTSDSNPPVSKAAKPEAADQIALKLSE